ncbi:serine protease [Pseudomonas paraversuta]|uniref:S1 family peptidase n=1 Tax=Pseudomonas paraversuta TaxID=2750624 RepID=UPI003D2CAD28
MKIIDIDFLSGSSVKVVPMFDSLELAVATAFFVSYKNITYLVTNWHVVTGRHPQTDQCVDKRLAIPNKLKIMWHDERKLGCYFNLVIDLYHQDERVWSEHPLGRAVDVVVIPVDAKPPLATHAFSWELANEDIKAAPGQPVSIVGYPLGYSGGGNLPIWKTGHIATDIEINFNGESPAFLIDATTRSGMSGSPVYIRSAGNYQARDGKSWFSDGLITRFLGVYSGRIHEDSEVGIVWRPDVLIEIIEHNKDTNLSHPLVISFR